MHSYDEGGIFLARISKEKQAEIKQKILDVSTMKFNRYGFEQVSTKDIAKEVGIAEGTLFNYFESKTMLFLEVFGEQFTNHELFHIQEIDLSSNIVDVLYNQLYNLVNLVIKLPKPILMQLVIASIKMAKKRPERFRKFVELDLKYIAQTKSLLDGLYERNILLQVDTKQLSETIYSVVMFEFVMYLYDETISKDAMLGHIKTKMRILLEPYIQGGQYGN